MHDKQFDPEMPPGLERYLALCEPLFKRMMETGEWPWSDQPK